MVLEDSKSIPNDFPVTDSRIVDPDGTIPTSNSRETLIKSQSCDLSLSTSSGDNISNENKSSSIMNNLGASTSGSSSVEDSVEVPLSPFCNYTFPSPSVHNFELDMDMPIDTFDRLNVVVDEYGMLRYKDTNKKVSLQCLQTTNINAAGLIDAIIYQAQYKLINNLSFRKMQIPSVAEALSPLARSEIFVSQDWCTADNLIIIINSSRGSRPGIWSRTLSFEEGIHKGSMAPFAEKATVAGYAVMILNPNLNTVTISGTKVPVEGSRTPEQHVEYCWDTFVSTAAARNIFILGHAYGGILAKHLLSVREHSIFNRLRGVCLTESFHCLQSELSLNLGSLDSKLMRDFLANRTINWQLSDKEEGKRLYTLEERKGCVCLSAGIEGTRGSTSPAATNIIDYFSLSKDRDFQSVQFAASKYGPLMTSSDLQGAIISPSSRSTSSENEECNKSSNSPDQTPNNLGKKSISLHQQLDDSSPYSNNSTLSSPSGTPVAPCATSWVPDDDVNSCMLCMKSFNFLVRKHHCRACGKVICYECGKQKIMVAGKKKPVRGCFPCFINLLSNNGVNNNGSTKVAAKSISHCKAENNHTSLKKSHSGNTINTNEFDLIKVIGKGSFGKVLLVRRKVDMNIYALKIIQKSTILKRKQLEHTNTERRVLQELSHPFISGLKFAFQTEGKLYLGMEFYSGGPLYHHLQQARKFNESKALFYVSEVFSGLSYLHGQNVIYRDLKPENLLIDKDGHVVISDFGLSKIGVEECDKGASTICGTPEYVAPEVLLGKKYGKAVDWWSLGTLLYEMLMGIPPFYDKNKKKMFHKILTAELVFKYPVSYNARSLIEGLLRRDPNERLGSKGSEEIMNHPFFAKIDWVALERRNVSPPWKPTLITETDTSNFNSKYTRVVPEDSPLHEADYDITLELPTFDRFTFDNIAVQSI